ncbi:pyridoxal-phosphate dependent enzyme [Luteimonas deserti]|uniref:Pyridoxal-phosphate dependent enzyme n=1 Tax=Luteimonas deserti TaxID=2752306 RepID=A0A7Z0TY63_9GAMM|nr:pyridoxal-phosphate dependent enzyme [Luteimonas deserti]NYZ62047.1 pyridoxal-phosphate dependent enzyme [Luteimonas deserti]
MSDVLPQPDDVLAASARIAPHADVTPVLQAGSIDDAAGCTLRFKAEHLQRAGAFKFRGACNAVWALEAAQAGRGVVTHSSGNHGAALALAARSRGIACHVVVPAGAVATKLAAIARYGAVLHRCDATLGSREATCEQVRQMTGATMVHPYADARVIAGQGTAALELLQAAGALDDLVVPVGGGGLAAGSALALQVRAAHTRLVLAEPRGADDALRSLRAGRRVETLVPETVCDGLRGLLGSPNFAILGAHRSGDGAAPVEVIPVDDADTVAAQRMLATRTKQLVEPSSAIALAAVLGAPARFAGRRVGIVLSGGNVDPDRLAWLH